MLLQWVPRHGERRGNQRCWGTGAASDPTCSKALRSESKAAAFRQQLGNAQQILCTSSYAQSMQTTFLVPIFGREKKDSDKVKMTTDLRDLNSYQEVPRHKKVIWKTALHTHRTNGDHP